MRIFVVGATGVLGRALLPLLQQQGHTVRTLVRSDEQVQALQRAGIDAKHGDLLSQEIEPRLLDTLEGCDAAVHIATAIPRNMSAPGAWDVNTRLRVEGTQRLLQASLAVGVKHYIQQSIVMAYPDGGDAWIYENTPLDASPQRASICAPVIDMEDLIRDIAHEQLHWCILRGGNFVGSETAQDSLIATVRTGKSVVPCDGKNFLSLIHVADMADAISKALLHAPSGTIFNIVDEPIRNGDYLDRLAHLVGAPRPQRDATQPCPPSQRCSNQAAQTILGWKPVYGIWPTIT
ncbi:MAG: NAD(P)-dependent oxidoreductase [Ktedonobacteraceae bacterium]